MISTAKMSDTPKVAALQARVDESGVAPADVDGDAPVERGREERADTGERHLAERQLPGPAGEDGQR